MPELSFSFAIDAIWLTFFIAVAAFSFS